LKFSDLSLWNWQEAAAFARTDGVAQARLKEAALKAKTQLSMASAVNITLSGIGNQRNFTVELSRCE